MCTPAGGYSKLTMGNRGSLVSSYRSAFLLAFVTMRDWRDWVYRSGVPAEDVEEYKPGGFHPLLLGARLENDRYEILHKLGFGAFGTVWLAKDMR